MSYHHNFVLFYIFLSLRLFLLYSIRLHSLHILFYIGYYPVSSGMSANFFTIYEQSNIISSFSESNWSLNRILNCRLRITMISLITVSRIFDRVWQYMKCSNVSSLFPHNRHILLFSPFLNDDLLDWSM